MISTITATSSFDGELNISKLFWVLPISYIHSESIERGLVPHLLPGEKGRILLAQYETYTRGTEKILKKKKGKKNTKKAFKNAISVKICLGEKEVSAKINVSGIHISGAHSKSEIEQCCDFLLSVIKETASNLEYFKKCPSDYFFSCSRWVEKCIYERVCPYILDNFYYKTSFPTEFDPIIMKVLLNNYFDFPDYSLYFSLIEAMRSDFCIAKIVPNNILDIDCRMTNYNFKIPHKIDKERFVQYLLYINELGVTIEFNNTLHYAIKLVLETDEVFKKINPGYTTSLQTKKKSTTHLHIFKIQTTGNIKITSRDDSTLKEAIDYVTKLVNQYASS